MGGRSIAYCPEAGWITSVIQCGSAGGCPLCDTPHQLLVALLAWLAARRHSSRGELLAGKGGVRSRCCRQGGSAARIGEHLLQEQAAFQRDRAQPARHLPQ